MKNLKIISAFFAALSMMFVMSISQAATLSFTNIENNTVDISSQLSVDIADTEGGITFTFWNDVGITSSVTDIYFDEGATDWFSGFEILASSGVLYSPTEFTDSAADPGVLPGGDAVGFSADYSADSSGNPENGIDASGEYITFLAIAGTGFTSYTDLLADALAGGFRMGLHVQAFADGASDSYVSVNPVPVPAAGILFASALLGAGALGRRKKKVKASVVGAFARAS